MNWKMPASLLLACILIPGASAVTISLDSDQGPIANDGPTELAFTVSVDCTADFLPDGVTRTVDVTIPDAPAWLTVTPATVDFASQDCLTGATMSLSAGGTITVSPTAAAPGMVPVAISLDADGEKGPGEIQVAYKMGYDFIVDAAFPLEIGPDGATFNATVHLFGNSRSMAMFNEEKADCVSVTGLPPGFYTAQDDALAGDLEVMEVFEITVTANCAEWEQASHEITTWSHFLDDGALKTNDMVLNWTFVPAAGTGGPAGDEGSPSPAMSLSALALLGAAFVAIRRRE